MLAAALTLSAAASASADTELTRPSRSASSASTTRPVSSRSRACAGPTTLGSSHVPAMPACMPSLLKGRPSLAPPAPPPIPAAVVPPAPEPEPVTAPQPSPEPQAEAPAEPEPEQTSAPAWNDPEPEPAPAAEAPAPAWDEPASEPAPPPLSFSDDSLPPPPPAAAPLSNSGYVEEEEVSRFAHEPLFRPRRNPAKMWTIAAALFALVAFASIGATAWYGLPDWMPFAQQQFAEDQPGLKLNFPEKQQGPRPLADGSYFFETNGTVTNVSQESRSVPAILVVLYNARGSQVFMKEIRSPKRVLAPGESVAVNEALVNVPRGAVKAKIGWKPGS